MSIHRTIDLFCDDKSNCDGDSYCDIAGVWTFKTATEIRADAHGVGWRRVTRWTPKGLKYLDVCGKCLAGARA